MKSDSARLGSADEQDHESPFDESIIDDADGTDNTAVSKPVDALLTSARELADAAPLGAAAQRLIAAGLSTSQVTATKCFSYRGGIAFSYLNPTGAEYSYGEGHPFFRYRANWSPEKRAQAARQLEELPKYLSPKDCACTKPYHSPLHVSDPTYAVRLKKTKYPVILPEGEIKALVSSAHEIATGSKTVTIGLGGVSAWSDKRTPVDEDGDRQLIPELRDEVEWSHRDVYITFDSDLMEKPSVRTEVQALAIALHKLGARVWLIRLPQELPGTYQDPKNGLDDFIIRHGYDAFLRLLNSATQLQVIYTNIKDGGREYSVKDFGAEPSNKSESHIKALMSWSVLKESTAVRPAVGAYRWEGTHWQEQEGKTRDALALQLETFYDSQRWINRVGAVFNNATAELERRLTVPKHRWAPSHLLAFTNVVLDTQTGETKPHNPSALVTSCLPYPYDTSAKCPKWEAFLLEALGNDPKLVALARAMLRWILMPKPRDEPFPIDKAFNCNGPRGSGKGTFVSTVRFVVGNANVGNGGPDVFGDKEKLAKLVDKKLALDSDAKGFLPNSTNFNKVVSNEPVIIEAKYKDSDDIALGVVVLWASNEPISVSNDGAEGVGRRLVSLPFNHKPEKVNINLKKELAAEAAGIFQWAWSMPEQQMFEILSGDVESVDAIDLAIDQLLASNTTLRWLSEHRPDGCDWTSVRDLFLPYADWAEKGRHKAISETAFGKELKRIHGAEFKRSNGSKVWLPPMRRLDRNNPLDLSNTDLSTAASRFYDYAKHLGIGHQLGDDGKPVHMDSKSDDDGKPVQQPVQPKLTATTAFSDSSDSLGQDGQVLEKKFSNSEGMGDTPSNTENNADDLSNRPTRPNPSVPEPLVNAQIATVHTWVSAAIDGLNDNGITPTADLAYAVINSWSRAPAISRNQVDAAFERINPTDNFDLFDF